MRNFPYGNAFDLKHGYRVILDHFFKFTKKFIDCV